MQTIISSLPEWVKKPLRRVRDIAKALTYYGKGRFCPVCGKSSRRFLRSQSGKDTLCFHCGAYPRHRFLWFYLSKQTDLFDGTPKKMLHVAPEPFFESKLKELLGDSYLTADFFDPRAMVKMDVTNIGCADESFDVIYCSHVLEHVQDDKKAIREFFRVLKNDGWAILLVPTFGEKTFEDRSIVDPTERLKYFGQKDHVRKYGRDFVDRLREAGFSVGVTEVNDLIPSKEVVRMGLANADEIYFCTK
jgi:SAM-dependent methyltransferase